MEPSDLVIRFDRDGKRILLLVPGAPSSPGDLKRFFEIPLGEEVYVNELSKEVGVAVASFLHARHGDHFKLREETSTDDSSEDLTFDEIRLLINRIDENSKLSELEKVDGLLKFLSKQGDSKAKSYLLEIWPNMYSTLKRRIDRNDSKRF